MKEYFCINLKFKNDEISSKTFHAHLYASDEEMYIQIIDNEVGSQIDRYFTMSKGALGLFEDNFEIAETEGAYTFEWTVKSQLDYLANAAFRQKIYK